MFNLFKLCKNYTLQDFVFDLKLCEFCFVLILNIQINQKNMQMHEYPCPSYNLMLGLTA